MLSGVCWLGLGALAPQCAAACRAQPTARPAIPWPVQTFPWAKTNLPHCRPAGADLAAPPAAPARGKGRAGAAAAASAGAGGPPPLALLQRLAAFAAATLPPGSGGSPPLAVLVSKMLGALATCEPFAVRRACLFRECGAQGFCFGECGAQGFCFGEVLREVKPCLGERGSSAPGLLLP